MIEGVTLCDTQYQVPAYPQGAEGPRVVRASSLVGAQSPRVTSVGYSCSGYLSLRSNRNIPRRGDLTPSEMFYASGGGKLRVEEFRGESNAAWCVSSTVLMRK